jgi:hypothetical protein
MRIVEPPELSDPKRLAAVARTGLLDSERDREFDQLTRLAAKLLATPSAFVTILDEDRQFVKSDSQDGQTGNLAGQSQPLSMSFCKHVVASREPLVVEDAHGHPLVRSNEAIAAGVIAYAGIPLETGDGQAVGALCVVDSKPRRWSGEDLDNLRALARSTMKLIEERAVSQGDWPIAASEPHDLLLAAAVKHMQAADAYNQLVQSPGAIDLKTEADARNNVVQSLADLRSAAEKITLSEPADNGSALLSAVEHYLSADEQRLQATLAFTESSIDLPALERIIATQIEAADQLRLEILNFGANL